LRDAPDGVWPAAWTSVRLHERHREPFIDAFLFSVPQLAPPDAFRKGVHVWRSAATNALDDDPQSVDDELVGKPKNAKSRASKPRIPCGVLDLRIRRLVRAAVRFDDGCSRKTYEIRDLGPVTIGKAALEIILENILTQEHIRNIMQDIWIRTVAVMDEIGGAGHQATA
jgi:hypothetical protein